MFIIIAHTFQMQLGEQIGVTPDGVGLHLLKDEVVCSWCGQVRKSTPGARFLDLFVEPCPKGRGYQEYVAGL